MKLVVTFIVSAALANGLIAGGDIDRWLVGMPAWQSVGILAWANYSRSADLGNGFVLYPILAIGGTMFSLAAIVVFIREGKHECLVVIPAYAAAALAVAGLLMTLKAAPFMLSLGHIGNEDVASLQRAFDGFKLWGGIRTVLQALAFGANLWSLAVIAKHPQAG
jgi:hypothetical protein